MDSRREKETRKTKNNMAKDCGKGERRGGVEDLGRRCGREQRTEKGEGPVYHQARGGLVTGNTRLQASIST